MGNRPPSHAISIFRWADYIEHRASKSHNAAITFLVEAPSKRIWKINRQKLVLSLVYSYEMNGVFKFKPSVNWALKANFIPKLVKRQVQQNISIFKAPCFRKFGNYISGLEVGTEPKELTPPKTLSTMHWIEVGKLCLLFLHFQQDK